MIATQLGEAKQTIPQFYLAAIIEIGRLIALREEANAAAPQDKDDKPAFKFSLNDFTIKAWAAACACPPPMRCGRATASAFSAFRHRRGGGAEVGLITPVVRTPKPNRSP